MNSPRRELNGAGGGGVLRRGFQWGRTCGDGHDGTASGCRVRPIGWSYQGTVEVVAELKAEDGGPFFGNLSLVPFAEVGLHPKSEDMAF
jgi:hypothetical protein